MAYAVHEVFAPKSAVLADKDTPLYWPEYMFDAPLSSQPEALECILHPDVLARKQQRQAAALNASSSVSLAEAQESSQGANNSVLDGR